MLEIFKPYGRPTRATMVLTGIAQLAMFVLLWYLVTLSGTDQAHGARRLHSFPSPPEVLSAFGFLITKKSLFVELWTSFSFNVRALVVSTLIAYPLCYLKIFAFMRPIIGSMTILRYLGVTGLTFTFMTLFNDVDAIKLAILVFGMTPWLVTGMAQTIDSIGTEEYNYAHTLKLGTIGTTWEVVIRSRLGDGIEIMRQNLAMSWMMVGTVEGLLRAGGGVGILLLESQKVLALDQIFAELTCILALGLLQDMSLRGLRRLVAPYDFVNTRSE